VSRPGQIEPNELELAILQRMAAKNPPLLAQIGSLHVLSREFTGVGCYTNFKCEGDSAHIAEQRIGLDDLIEMPNVQNGLGAVLLCLGGLPTCLETYTFGAELWDGVFEGFRFKKRTEN
jgi:hypothetical protein